VKDTKYKLFALIVGWPVPPGVATPVAKRGKLELW
jgi:hypothetical protein